VGHAKLAHADKTGATFTYQKSALKSDGGQIVGPGFAVFSVYLAGTAHGQNRLHLITDMSEYRRYIGGVGCCSTVVHHCDKGNFGGSN
jgi:hypothetical protein